MVGLINRIGVGREIFFHVLFNVQMIIMNNFNYGKKIKKPLRKPFS